MCNEGEGEKMEKWGREELTDKIIGTYCQCSDFFPNSPFSPFPHLTHLKYSLSSYQKAA